MIYWGVEGVMDGRGGKWANLTYRKCCDFGICRVIGARIILF